MFSGVELKSRNSLVWMLTLSSEFAATFFLYLLSVYVAYFYTFVG